MDLQSQREEAEEARKMDEARANSEVIVIDNNSDDEALRASTEELLGKHITGRGVKTSIFFPDSLVLQSKVAHDMFYQLLVHDDTQQRARKEIVHFLTLEKRARKWFGLKVPQAYFQYSFQDKLVEWNAHPLSKKMTLWDRVQHLLPKLQDERAALELAMYSLSEQVKGGLGFNIPKLFVAAKDEAIKKGIIPPENTGCVISLDIDDE